MPEGPEIQLAADKYGKALINRPVTEIYFAFDHLRVYEPQLAGQPYLC